MTAELANTRVLTVAFTLLLSLQCPLAYSHGSEGTSMSELDAQQAVDACRRLVDPTKRLACYDRIQGISVTGGRYEPKAESDSELIATETQPSTTHASETPANDQSRSR